MKITVVVEKSSGGLRTPRESNEVDRFVAALRTAMDGVVSIVEGTASDAPSDGFVILFQEASFEEMKAISERLIIINVERDWTSYLDDVSPLAAIDKHRYVQWRTKPDNGRGVIVRKDFAASMDCELSESLASDRLAMCIKSPCSSLTAFLCSYPKAVENQRSAAGET
mgnify:CR=1 FL=1